MTVSSTIGFSLPNVVIVIGILFILRTLFKKVGIWFITAEIGLERKRNVVDSIFYVSTLLFSVVFGEYFTSQELWRHDYDHCFVGFPNRQENNWGLEAYYVYGIAFYTFSFLCLFLDEKKKDFNAMILHHIVTILLILVSGLGGMHRIGAVIMISFDKSDILLESAKICNRLKLHNSAAIFFVLFVISWIIYRVYDYPRYVLSSVFRAQQLSDSLVPQYEFCVVSLCVIYLLQIYWSWFIIKKLITMYKKGITAGEDPREDSFKEHEEHNQSTKDE